MAGRSAAGSRFVRTRKVMNDSAGGGFMRTFPSLKRRGGCGVNKKSRSHRSAADGVVRPAKSFGLKSFAELTTSSAPVRLLRDIFLIAHPPLLFKEGNRA